MLTRKFIQGLLLAALVPVAFIGVKSWQYDREVEPGVVAAPVHTLRPQLGRALRGRWPQTASQAGDPERTFSATTPETAGDDPELDEAAPAVPDTAPPTTPAAPVTAATAETSRDDQSAKRAAPLTGAYVRAAGRVTAPHASTASATPGLPLVEFVGVMQDETLLKRSDFPAESVRQLKVIVWWTVSGGHAQRLEFFTPAGTLYRRIVTDFTGSAGGGVRTPVETLLPVGGSWITEHSLFGAWRVDVYLDKNKTAATTAGFVLNP